MSTEITTLGIKVTTKGTAKAKKEIKSIGVVADKIKKSLGSLLVGGIAISGARKAIQAFKMQEQAIAKLGASIKSMNRVTPDLSSNLQDLASQIQRQGIIGDEALLEGASFLTTYSAITDDLLPRTMRIMSDFAAKMGGNTVQAANLLGKASMGLTGELSRMGITLSREAKKTKNFKLILSEIEEQVQGMNRALAATDTGKLTQVSNAFGDLQEILGKEIVSNLAPILVGITNEALNAKIALDGFNQTQLETAKFGTMLAEVFGRVWEASFLNQGIKAMRFMADGLSQLNDNANKFRMTLDGIADMSDFEKSMKMNVEFAEAERSKENLKQDIIRKQESDVDKIIGDVIFMTEKLTKKRTALEKITDAQVVSEKILGEKLKNSKITLGQYTEGINMMKTEIQNYNDVVEQIAFDKKVEKMAQSMEDSITTSLMNMGQGLNSFKDLAKGIFRGIALDMVRMQISKPISGAISGFIGNTFGSMFGAPSGGMPHATFAGGGFTGTGSRSGGVDNQGGFPAILHPNETIIDHTKGGQTGGNTNITVHYSPQVNALDPRTAANVIAENAPVVVGIIRQAFNRTGQSIGI
jgi:hypothetical protein